MAQLPSILKRFVSGLISDFTKEVVIQSPLIKFSYLAAERTYIAWHALSSSERNELLEVSATLDDRQIEDISSQLAISSGAEGRNRPEIKRLTKNLLTSLHTAGMHRKTGSENTLQTILGGLCPHEVIFPENEPLPLPLNSPNIVGYQLINKIGSGGASTVYSAKHCGTGQLHAIKVIDDVDPVHLKRELQVAREIVHENIVAYYADGETEDGRKWIAMEFVGQATLAHILRSRPLNVEETIILAKQILRGLVALHTNAITHRDLKPQNILVGSDGRARLIDFGLAKRAMDTSTETWNKTATGVLMGTLSYMSPEQSLGASVGPATDIWAFGIVLYQMLTGRLPYSEKTTLVRLSLEIHTAAFDFENSKIPQELCSFLRKCLVRDASLRYANAMDALEAFEKPAGEASDRSKFERMRPKWERILKEQLVQQFAIKFVEAGGIVRDSPGLFCNFAKDFGIEDLDVELLHQVFPPILDKCVLAIEATNELNKAMKTLAKINADSDLEHLAEYQQTVITTHSQILTSREEDVANEIQRQIGPSTLSWDELNGRYAQTIALKPPTLSWKWPRLNT